MLLLVFAQKLLIYIHGYMLPKFWPSPQVTKRDIWINETILPSRDATLLYYPLLYYQTRKTKKISGMLLCSIKKANRAWETKPQARTYIYIYIFFFFVVSWHVLIFAVIGYNTINIDLIESTSKPQNGSNWKPVIFLYWFFIGQYILSFIFTHLMNI